MHLGPLHAQTAPGIELGNEPPLVVYDERSVLPNRRKVSVRWLSGTILTGLTSIFLMGGALIVALDGQYEVANVLSPGDGDASANHVVDGPGSKGDLVLRKAAQFATKQIVPVSIVTKDGDKDHIQVKPYALVNANLETRKNPEVEARIPPFNPMQMFAENKPVSADPAASDSIYGAKVEGEVSISMNDFPVGSPDIDAAHGQSEEAVEQQVRLSGHFLSSNTVDIASRAMLDPGRFDFDLAKQSEFSRLSIRITPENVSFVSKQEEEQQNASLDERIIPISDQTDMKSVLLDNDVPEADAVAITSAFKDSFGIEDLTPGLRVRLAVAHSVSDDEDHPERVSIYDDTTHKATVALDDAGQYVRAQAPTTMLNNAFAEADRLSYGGPTPTLYDSIYQTALEQDIPETAISELIHIFSADADYNSHIRPGDNLEVFYSDPKKDDGASSADQAPEVLYASLTTGNVRHRYYRFRTPDDGKIDYYDSEGHSAKKFLMRKPLTAGRFTSGFGVRRHPIRGILITHTGVDWAAPRGTPIMATGDGVVEKAGWSSGYGRFTLLRHANGYETAYGHQSAIADGIKPGVHVKQGEIIGYVGSSGLSTGPHVHYEVRINNKYVDPMRVRLPRGRVLEGNLLASFENERNRIDALIDRGGNRPSTRVASR